MIGKKKFNWRRAVQVFFFVLIGIISINHSLAESGGGIPYLSNASLHAICPFGGVVTLYQLATLGTFVQKIHAASVILMVLVFILAILFGPVFCGWICPLGSIQEWIGRIGKKIFKKKYNNFLPEKLDSVLRYLRYVVLILVVYLTAKSGVLVFSSYDPYHALFNFWSSETAVLSIVILAITLLLSLFVERPWCKYACPYGALLGLSNIFRIFKITRSKSTCINCKKCDKSCPMNIKVSEKNKGSDHQCISCYECTSEVSCPVADTVSLQANFGKSSVKKEETANED